MPDSPENQYQPWDMGDEDQAALRRQLDDALFGGLPSPEAIDDIVDQVGRDRLIQELSGTEDRSSREWKNARDNVSRWRRGARRPGQASQQRIRGASQNKQRSDLRSRGRMRVTFTATLVTSRKPWEGKVDGWLTGPAVDSFLDAQAVGDDQFATQIVVDAYGMDPDLVMRIEGFGGFDIQ